MKEYLTHLFTARDNETFSLTKLIGSAAFVAMIVQFVRTSSVDFQGFAIGVSTMMAALAVKYAVEKP